jgi:hypothetical protein
MKPETRKALIGLSTEAKQEVITLLSQHMDPEEFANAFYDDNGDPTTEGLAIIDHVQNDDENEDAVRDEIISGLIDDADILHAAICEGRKQDAIDILNSLIPEANLRRVSTQNYLFPERVHVDL